MPSGEYWTGYDRILKEIQVAMERRRYVSALRGVVELLQRTVDARAADEAMHVSQFLRSGGLGKPKEHAPEQESSPVADLLDQDNPQSPGQYL